MVACEQAYLLFPAVSSNWAASLRAKRQESCELKLRRHRGEVAFTVWTTGCKIR